MYALFSTVLLIVCYVFRTNGGDISLLCSGDKPIDAGLHFRGQTVVIKGSNVWYFNGTNADIIEGPTPIKSFFKDLEVDSIDAVFNIKVSKTVDDAGNTQRMAFLALLFKGQNYYIFEFSADYKYHYYQNAQGVPFGLTPGKGSINLLKSNADNIAIDSAFFDQKNSKALLSAGTDVYEVSSFEQWTSSSANRTKSLLSAVIGVNVKVDAAIDFSPEEVLVIIGQNYCIVKWSEKKCNTRPVVEYFKCKESGQTTISVTTVTDPLSETSSLIHRSTDQHIIDDSESSPLVMIILILIAILVGILILSFALFCFVSKRKKNTGLQGADSTVANSLTSTNMSTTETGSKKEFSTFSGAFGAKSELKT